MNQVRGWEVERTRKWKTKTSILNMLDSGLPKEFNCIINLNAMRWPVVSVSEQTLWTHPSHPRHATVVFLKACFINIALLWYIYCFGHNNIICSTINVRHRVKWDHVIMILYSNISGGLLDAGDMARVVGAVLCRHGEYEYTYIIIWVLGCSIDDWFTCAVFSWTSRLWEISLGEGAIQTTPSLCFLKYIYYVAVF